MSNSLTTRTVTEDQADSRLDRYLRRHVEGLSQAMIQKLCRTGKIRIDGKKAEASTHVPLGAAITLPPIAAPAELPKIRHVMTMDAHMIRDLEASILYRDDAVILLNKPSGLPSQGGKGIAVHLDGMLDALRFDGTERPKLVHRLDRDTSGVLLLARTARAAQKLASLFRGRDIEKTYFALLAGVPETLEGRIDLPLKRVEFGNISRAEPTNRKDPDGQKAVTDYKIVDYAGRKFCLAALQPHTGRMHQLRAHCLALGTPILGDAAYGGVTAEHFADQLHLHARRLVLPHPDGGSLFLEAELPEHMREGMKYLGFTVPPVEKPKWRK